MIALASLALFSALTHRVPRTPITQLSADAAQISAPFSSCDSAARLANARRAVKAQQQAQRPARESTRSLAEDLVDALHSNAQSVFTRLRRDGYAYIDLDCIDVEAMRKECVQMLHSGRMTPSETSLCNDAGELLEVMHKPGVFAFEQRPQLDTDPRLSEYIDTLADHLPALFNEAFPEEPLSTELHAVKLAVTMGEGSENPRHLDKYRHKPDFRRLTSILYLNKGWEPSQGGCFRAYMSGRFQAADGSPHVDIQPRGGRLLLFWANELEHGVQPAFAPTEDTYRWAFTVWFPSAKFHDFLEQMNKCNEAGQVSQHELTEAEFRKRMKPVVDKTLAEMAPADGLRYVLQWLEDQRHLASPALHEQIVGSFEAALSKIEGTLTEVEFRELMKPVIDEALAEMPPADGLRHVLQWLEDQRHLVSPELHERIVGSFESALSKVQDR